MRANSKLPGYSRCQICGFCSFSVLKVSGTHLLRHRQAKLSPQFWETVLGEGLRQGQVPFELQMHQAPQAGQGQCSQLVVSQIPRTVDDQGYWQSVGLLRGQGFVEGVASVPGMKARGKEQRTEDKYRGDSVYPGARVLKKVLKTPSINSAIHSFNKLWVIVMYQGCF